MKYFLVLLLGIVVGAALGGGFLFYNPMTSTTSLSPLSVSDHQQFSLNFSAVADDAIVYTNDGESRVSPNPERVLQLWEATIRQTETLVTPMYDSRDMIVGMGIKFSSRSERTRLLNGEYLIDSVWHVYLPGRGTLFVGQTENHWNFVREIVVPAHWNAGDSWRGNWHATVTSGPGALGTARVYGGGGEFAGVDAEAIEILTAAAYSSKSGPVALDGQLLVELPSADSAAGLSAESGER